MRPFRRLSVTRGHVISDDFDRLEPVAHALEKEHRPLRLPVGADAELIAASRQGAS